MQPLAGPLEDHPAIEFLRSRIDYERTSQIPYSQRDFRLDRMRQLLDRLGNPHQGLPIVHVAGTKGKGSTAAMINFVKNKRPKKVVMVTECSMADNVQVETPGVEFVRPCNLCPHMKRITLPKILDSLVYLREEIEIDPAIADRARRAPRQEATPAPRAQAARETTTPRAEVATEYPPMVGLGALVAAELAHGDGFTVDDPVPTDGLMAHFSLHSDGGEAEVIGADLLRIRVAEVGALAQLRSVSGTKRFLDAAALRARGA